MKRIPDTIFIVGCTHNLTLIPRQGGEKGQGVAQEVGKAVTITINGKTYTGNYVYGGGSVAFPNGRILVTSPDGDAIRCELQYSSGIGLGICKDNAGKEYDLQIHN